MKNKKNLSEIQIALQEAILNKSFPTLLINEISEKPPISTERRLEIYQDAYQIRMVESLREDFPEVEKTLNAESNDRFESIAIEFLKIYPSKYRNLSEVSQHFPEFLKNKSPILHNLAVQDWLCVLSSYAADPEDNTIVPVDAIQNGEKFMLRKHPASFAAAAGSHQYLSFRYLWESQVIEVSEIKIELIHYLDSPRSLEEFSNKSFALGMNESELGELLSNWIKNEIIFCERPSK